VALAPGCRRGTPSFTPDELIANWEKHKGQTVVLSGSPKFVAAVKNRNLATFYGTGENYRIMAEVAEGVENLKADQPCKLQCKVKGLEFKTLVLENCKLIP